MLKPVYTLSFNHRCVHQSYYKFGFPPVFSSFLLNMLNANFT